MKNAISWFEIPSTDLDRAQRFYETIFKVELFSTRCGQYPYGTILSCNGKDSFKFSFGDAGICTVSIKEEGLQCIVEILQNEIPVDEHGRQYWHLGCKTGWTFHLTNMKSIFEGGIDLRNKDEKIKNVANA